MGFWDWMFRSRKTGRITLAQLPNWQLVVWLLASAAMWLSGQVCKSVGGWSARGATEVEAGGAVEGVLGQSGEGAGG
jgi:hypothetical protein